MKGKIQMLIGIDDIVISDRIRKDFGNIQELADDIKQNGLINPPVVTQIENGKYQLIAGERRIRAMRLLGYSQVEVRPMSVRDAEHQLDLEISENAVRKDWTKTEMLEIARRKERMSAIKAKENQEASRFGGVREFSETVDSSMEAAKVIGVSDNTYRRMKTIDENRSLLTPADFEDWDEGRLSTNKAYNKIKERMKELEAENERLKSENECLNNALDDIDTDQTINALNEQILELDNQVTSLTQELSERPTVQIKVIPKDYADLKDKAAMSDKYKKQSDAYQQDYRNEQAKVADKVSEILKLQDKLQEMEKKLNNVQFGDVGGKSADRAVDASVYFCAGVANFIRDFGGYVWIVDYINELPELERNNYKKAVESIYAWAQILLSNISGGNNYEIAEL